MDLSELKGIISLVQKSDLTELEIEFKDIKLRMTRPGAITPGHDSVREIVVQAPPPTPSGTTPSPFCLQRPRLRRRGPCCFQLAHGWHILPQTITR